MPVIRGTSSPMPEPEKCASAAELRQALAQVKKSSGLSLAEIAAKSRALMARAGRDAVVDGIRLTGLSRANVGAFTGVSGCSCPASPLWCRSCWSVGSGVSI